MPTFWRLTYQKIFLQAYDVLLMRVFIFGSFNMLNHCDIELIDASPFLCFSWWVENIQGQLQNISPPVYKDGNGPGPGPGPGPDRPVPPCGVGETCMGLEQGMLGPSHFAIPMRWCQH